jgi:hypothetical protein
MHGEGASEWPIKDIPKKIIVGMVYTTFDYVYREPGEFVKNSLYIQSELQH